MTDLLMTVDDLTITDRFVATRSLTESLASPLSAEDQTVQSMPDVSPTKWHRAHTTWFFETFLLVPDLAGYRPFHPAFGYLFNSYYEGVGARYPRPDRGLLSRPGVTEIAEYRRHVDRGDDRLCSKVRPPRRRPRWSSSASTTSSSIRSSCSWTSNTCCRCNPTGTGLRRGTRCPRPAATQATTWTEHPGGTCEIGHAGRRVRLRQRVPPPPRLPRALRPRRTGGDLRRVAWTSSTTAATTVRSCGCPTAGPRSRPRGGSARSTGRSPERRLAGVHPGRADTGQPGPARLPRELLRGRRLRPLGGHPAAHRGRVGAWPPPIEDGARATSCDQTELHSHTGRHRRVRRRSTPVRGRLAVDLLGVQPLPGVRPRPRSGRRVQRQVHGQPVRAARRIVRDTTRPHPGHLPQLLPTVRPLGLHRSASGPNCRRGVHPPTDRRRPRTARAHDHRHPPDHRRPPVRRRSPRRHRSATSASGSPPRPSSSRRSTSTTTGAAGCSTRSPGCPSTTPPGAERSILDAHAKDIVDRSDGRHAGRAGRRHLREVPGPARRHARRPAACSRYVPLDVSDTTLWDGGHCPGRGVPRPGRPRRGRRLPPPPRPPARPTGDGCSPSSAAPSATSTPTSAATSSIDLGCGHGPRRPPPARHRPGQGPDAPGQRLRRRAPGSPPSSTATCSTSSTASSAPTSTRSASSTWPGGTRRTAASRCGCGRSTDQPVHVADLDLEVAFAAGRGDAAPRSAPSSRPDGSRAELSECGFAVESTWASDGDEFLCLARPSRTPRAVTGPHRSRSRPLSDGTVEGRIGVDHVPEPGVNVDEVA